MRFKILFSVICIFFCLFISGAALLITGVHINTHVDNLAVNIAEAENLEPDKAIDEASTVDTYDVPEKERSSINILVLGCDDSSGSTDTILLINYNPSTADIKMLSIPRDTKAPIRGSSIPKINSAYAAGGMNEALEVVGGLLNSEINYYILLNTSIFRKMIDILDGVDVKVPADMDYDDPVQNLHIHLKKGLQHLDGKNAEGFVRFRKPNSYTDDILKFYDGSDLKRIGAQQYLLKEIIHQKVKLKYIAKIKDIIDVVLKGVKTNITIADALNMSAKFGDIKYNELKAFTLPGNDVLEKDGLWYYIPDKEKTEELINNYFDVYK